MNRKKLFRSSKIFLKDLSDEQIVKLVKYLEKEYSIEYFNILPEDIPNISKLLEL